jgi:DNA primase small subunit
LGKELNNEGFVKKMFKKYYAEWEGEPPKDFNRREFAFVISRKGEMIRHKAFEEWGEVREFLRKNSPLHVYYSSAYYAQPSASDMDAKEWMGADLIFDIDVDHIYTPCKERHDRWTCLDCNTSGRGMPPEACPKCSSKRVEVKTWFCEGCLEVAKEETTKLVEDFLIQDFNFSPREISIVFSGRRGFHVHVESDVVKELDQRARREIVDYVRGTGLVVQNGKRRVLAPPLNAGGWPGRLAKGVYELLNAGDIEGLLNLRRGSKVEEVLKAIVKGLEESRDYWPLEGLARKIWFKAVEKVIVRKRCEVDERVTTDIKRLIRMPGTLHGGTGLIAAKVHLKDLESFDPYVHAVAFVKGEIKVKVLNMPEITFLNQTWGPYNDEVVELPIGLAVYLICSENAIVVGEGDENA